MADIPFFRGENRMDMLYALLLQTACDWRSPEQVVRVANVWGHVRSRVFSFDADIAPEVWVIVCNDYVFVVSASTHSALQWYLNVLGSGQSSIAGVEGRTQAYFGSVANAHFREYRDFLLQNVQGRKVVFFGFSLGAASVTIEKAILEGREGIDSACFAFGCPRVGNERFCALYPVQDYLRFNYFEDVIQSLPPPEWSETGVHNGWVPYNRMVEYDWPQPGFHLKLPDQIIEGDKAPSTSQVIIGLDRNLYLTWHSQDLYARILRAGLPKELPNGYEGYPLASQIDDLAYNVFFSGFFGAPSPTFSSPPKGDKLIQAVIYIRDKTVPLGFQETYMFNGSNPDDVFDYFNPASPAVAFSKRLAFLSSSCEIYAFRCSVVGGPRKSHPYKFANPLPGAVSATMADIEDSICYFGFSANRDFKRQFHYRGVPATYLDASKLSGTGVGALPLIDAWHTFLQAGVMVIADPSKGVTSNFGNVTKATNNDPCVLVLNTPVTLSDNALVVVTACRKTPLLNGSWLVTAAPSVPVNTLTLSGSERLSPAPTSIGKVRAQTFTGAVGTPIRIFQFNAVSSKKTGRPSFLRRGRQSVRLRHR